jgi:cation transport regulator ChaB
MRLNMLYEQNRDLPQAVQAMLPIPAQTIFRQACNQGQDAGRFQRAWLAVSDAGYVRCSSGQWRKRAKRAKKAAPKDDAAPRIDMMFEVAKADADQNLVFGWLSVATKGNDLVVDTEGHVIRPEVLERAAYDFVVKSRLAGEMHRRIGIGNGLVESMMFTEEKQKALGIDLGKVGLWVGFRVDDEAFAKVKDGTYRAFSLGGTGILRSLDEEATDD